MEGVPVVVGELEHGCSKLNGPAKEDEVTGRILDAPTTAHQRARRGEEDEFAPGAGSCGGLEILLCS